MILSTEAEKKLLTNSTSTYDTDSQVDSMLRDVGGWGMEGLRKKEEETHR